MSQRQSTYSADTLSWFDQAWMGGVSVPRIQDGMAERGHEMNPDQAAGLASRPGLMRPVGFLVANGRVIRPGFDDMARQRLSRPVSVPDDNRVVKPAHPITYPGGYRMGQSR